MDAFAGAAHDHPLGVVAVIEAVLLACELDSPLLRGGPGGSRPPVVYKAMPPGFGWMTWWPPFPIQAELWALPLFWNAKLVRAGWDHARSVLFGLAQPHVQRSVASLYSPTLADLRDIGSHLVQLHQASRVVLLDHLHADMST